MQFIDTHTHLYAEQFKEDRDTVLNQAISEGVNKFFLPNIDSTSIKGMEELVEQFPNNCFPMMGLHPCSVNDNFEKELAIVEKQLAENKFIAVGEIGIDLYWDKSTLGVQQIAFKQQIEWAKNYNLPIVIHCREAFDEIFEVLDELNDDKLFGVFHCFTGDLEQAEKILAYGNFKLGIGGVLTFKNAGLDKIVANINLKDLVLETDSPYLAPKPYRGKRNESKYLIHIAEFLAEIHNMKLSEIAKVTTNNAIEIFKINEI